MRKPVLLRYQLPRISSSLLSRGVFSLILRYDTFTPRFYGNSKIFPSQALHRPAPEPIASLSLSVRDKTVAGRWDRSLGYFAFSPLILAHGGNHMSGQHNPVPPSQHEWHYRDPFWGGWSLGYAGNYDSNYSTLPPRHRRRRHRRE